MTASLARIIAVALGGVALLGLSACGLEKPYPAKSFYTIEVPQPQAAPPGAGNGVLRVAQVRIAPPYNERAFHYQKTSQQFESDYYVNFITDPANIITGTLIDWLSREGSFATVVDASSPVKTGRTLEGRISALYGDYRQPRAPKAVVRAKFFLLDESGVDARVLFSREYEQVEPMSKMAADVLIDAWGSALERIYEALVRDISR